MRRRIKRRKLFYRWGKLLLLLLVLGICVFGITMVNAGINDSKIEKNRIDGIYAVTNLNGRDRIFYLNMYTLNDRISYCIEVGVDIVNDVYNSTYDFSVSKLSNSKIKYIKNISYFGYGYPGHNNYRYYMAAQELIWEYLNGIEVFWTNELDVNGERIDIESYKKDILSLVSDYNGGLDLRGYEEHTRVNIGDMVDIVDINDNFKYYDIKAGSHMTAKVIDNVLYVQFDTDYVGKDRLVLSRKDIYGYDSLLYYQGNSQKLISNGNILEEVELEFDIEGKSINFYIVDNSGIKSNNQYGFDGIVYEMFNKDNEYIGEISGSNFKNFIDNIPYGEYCVKQIKTNDAYMFNEQDYCFSFNQDTKEIYLEVVPVVRDVEILKLYGEVDNLKKESGAVFDIYNVDGSLYERVITDSEGLIKIKLPYGEYLIKQISGISGYYMIDEFNIDIRDSEEVISYTLVNEMIKTNLVINSKNVFGDVIKDSNIYYKVKSIDNDSYLEVDNYQEFGNNLGQLLVPVKIGYGRYLIEVINKSDDYKEVVENIEFEINENSEFRLEDSELYFDVSFEYEILTGSISLSTYKEKFLIKDTLYYYDYAKNGNVKLELIANDKIIVNEELIYDKGSKVLDIITDENGEYIVDDLFFGSYCLVSEFSDDVCFDVINEDVLELEVFENLDKGFVKIHNISNNLEDIEDSIISFYDKDNNLIFTGITNEFGEIKIDDLAYGDYCIKQKGVNDLYILNEEVSCFTINSSEGRDLEIINKEKSKDFIEVPNTFSDDVNINFWVIFILFIIGGVLYKVKFINSK